MVDLVVAVVDLAVVELVTHPHQVLHKELMAVVEMVVEHLLVVEAEAEQTQLEEQLDHAHLQEEKVEQE
jgi:LPS sulfotransferase NodH